MERRRTFSREFKLEAVRLVTERGVAVTQAAKDLDVHENVLRKWVRELLGACRTLRRFKPKAPSETIGSEPQRPCR